MIIDVMEKTKTIAKTIKENPLPWLVQLVGVIVVILNLYLATKLSPIEQNINVNAQSIEQIKKDTEELLGQHNEYITERELTTFTLRLDRIEAKLDRLIER